MTKERWARTEELYHDAQALPAHARAAFLAEACNGDDALRAEVASLLDASDDEFLVTPAFCPADLIDVTGTADLTGRTIGVYRIEALVGAGGMGDVYRARDTLLDRVVAIKVLPLAFLDNADRLARFRREARMLAAMSHPNICGIHGLEEADGLTFLVLEFVEGETLAARLAVRPSGAGLPLAEALSLAQQIAAALEAAHERGVIHRDLKPANIIITGEDIAKVLDFGLAKGIDNEGQDGELTVPPAHASGAGLPGAVIGTAAYMSAEQAAGRIVDRRTDIWAFGVVLFEMVSGARPFAGETVSETLASVLKTQPEWNVLPPTINADLRRLLRRCLEKDPKRRLQSIADARVQIEDLLRGEEEESIGRVETKGRVKRPLPWVAGGAVAILLGIYLGGLRVQAPPVTRLSLLLSDAKLDGSGGGHIVAISPDGRRVVFAGKPEALYVRNQATGDVKVISGTQGYRSVREPAFSPDGRWIVFFASSDQTLKRVSIDGGVAVTICPAKNPYGINWGPDGIVFAQSPGGILRVSHTGATPPEQIVAVKDGEVAHGPQLLPGGRHVLFTLATGAAADRWDTARIVVQSLTSLEPVTLITGGSDARYLPTGHLVYASGGSLFAVRFDLERLKTKGDPVSMVEGVRRSEANWSGAAHVSISSSSLAYVPGPAAPSYAGMDIGIMDGKTGEVQALNLPAQRYATPRVSPDGTQIALVTEGGRESAVWTYELSGTTPIQKLTLTGNNRFPVWLSPNSIAFQSNSGGDLAIFRQSPGGVPERLTTPEQGVAHAPQSWSAKTNTLLYSASKAGKVSLWTVSLAGGSPKPFQDISSPSAEYSPAAVFSPSGDWVAYGSAEGGGTTIYVKRFPASGSPYQFPRKGSDGPHEPVWSPQEDQLFYNPRAGGFEAVQVTTKPTFKFGKSTQLPRKFQMGPPGTPTTYDVTRDGGFVGVITSGLKEYDRGPDDRIEFILNWIQELKQRSPR